MMPDLTEDEKRKFGDGMGGYSSKRALDYQSRWRAELAEVKVKIAELRQCKE